MNPKRVLAKDTIIMRLKSDSKDGVIEELIDLLVNSGRIKDRKAALKAVVDREKKMSTGLQNGIAIPHGKTDTIDSLVAAIGISPDGIPFESLDGQPAGIILLTVSPASRTGPHIQFLADISRVLHNDQTRQRVLHATSEEEVLELLSGDAPPPSPGA
ncbi:MAG TPA: PTS sugar transporter subunit IIA [Kiritimatiellia bacterium]|nr:PTS sugar transporter subunit IIA [Kiritimatiellia bacterium]HMP00262.1 PTS sugar transporter subunit IIA [Kiritimatiellia bacterium]HMP97510.1 PTS sugar transporter subunit IIA [Kiritimatiellia bacterium]